MQRLSSSIGRVAAAPLSPLAATAAALCNSAPRTASFHTSASSQRGSKNLDWYHNALKRIAREKVKVEPPVFPRNPLHGKPRARAFIDWQTGKDADAAVQRVVIELADDIVPFTVENFLKLCANEAGHGYKGSEIFKIQKGFALFAGDYKTGNGRGSWSSFPEQYFPDENFIGRHSAAGVVGMANSGVHSNGSVFYITLAPQRQLDGRNVVLGRVIDGMDVVNKLASSLAVNLKPATPISIKDCGKIEPDSKEWKAIDAKIAAAEKAAAAAAAKAKGATAAPAAAAAVAAPSTKGSKADKAAAKKDAGAAAAPATAAPKDKPAAKAAPAAATA